MDDGIWARARSAFRTRRMVERLSALAVATTLSSLTGAGFASFGPRSAPVALVAMATTFVVALVWLWTLRFSRTFGRRKWPLALVVSGPLAALNASLAAGLLMQAGAPSLERFVLGMLLGPGFGAVIWIPAWLLTLTLFWRPLSRARELAAKGLAGRERGEGRVGAHSAILAALGLGYIALLLGRDAGSVGAALVGLVGLVAGVAATMLARRREAARHAFVAAVEAGQVPQFRIEPTAEGKALVRLRSEGSAYRVADHEEELARLDETHEVTLVGSEHRVDAADRGDAGASDSAVSG